MDRLIDQIRSIQKFVVVFGVVLYVTWLPSSYVLEERIGRAVEDLRSEPSEQLRNVESLATVIGTYSVDTKPPISELETGQLRNALRDLNELRRLASENWAPLVLRAEHLPSAQDQVPPVVDAVLERHSRRTRSGVLIVDVPTLLAPSSTMSARGNGPLYLVRGDSQPTSTTFWCSVTRTREAGTTAGVTRAQLKESARYGLWLVLAHLLQSDVAEGADGGLVFLVQGYDEEEVGLTDGALGDACVVALDSRKVQEAGAIKSVSLTPIDDAMVDAWDPSHPIGTSPLDFDPRLEMLCLREVNESIVRALAVRWFGIDGEPPDVSLAMGARWTSRLFAAMGPVDAAHARLEAIVGRLDRLTAADQINHDDDVVTIQEAIDGEIVIPGAGVGIRRIDASLALTVATLALMARALMHFRTVTLLLERPPMGGAGYSKAPLDAPWMQRDAIASFIAAGFFAVPPVCAVFALWQGFASDGVRASHWIASPVVRIAIAFAFSSSLLSLMIWAEALRAWSAAAGVRAPSRVAGLLTPPAPSAPPAKPITPGAADAIRTSPAPTP